MAVWLVRAVPSGARPTQLFVSATYRSTKFLGPKEPSAPPRTSTSPDWSTVAVGTLPLGIRQGDATADHMLVTGSKSSALLVRPPGLP